jgi:hypothetical protein
MIYIYDCDPLPLTITKQYESPKVNDPYDALVYVREPTTYIYDSYHKTTTLTIENDANPLKQIIPIMYWYTFGNPLQKYT